MKKLIISGATALMAIAALLWFWLGRTPQLAYKFATLERGTIVSTISATGTVNAVTTVSVGSQVSGTIQKLYVDYNSRVKRGQIIAEIDPALFVAQVEQARGAWQNAQAALQKARVVRADAGRTLERNRQLLSQGIIAQSDYDAAQTAYDEALAGIKAADAGLTQSKGTLLQAETNLKNSVIRSPVDGVVISRSIDVGQTVAASFQTPTLFTIAQDLTKMEIDTSVDESDISRVRVGQPVSFTVDAYPETRFSGKVTQIRNAPVITQNVVTYVVVVAVDNKELKLKPGMTANVSIETARKDNVLMIPAAALRFKPKTAKPASKAPGAEGAPVKRPSGQTVYLLGPENRLQPVVVKTGISNDGQVELVEGALKENDLLVTEQMTAGKKQSGMGRPMGPRF